MKKAQGPLHAANPAAMVVDDHAAEAQLLQARQGNDRKYGGKNALRITPMVLHGIDVKLSDERR